MKFTEKQTLHDLAATHPRCKGSINTFIKIVEAAQWKKPTDVNGVPHGTYKGSSNNVTCNSGITVWIFDVANNELRVIAAVDYLDEVVTVLWVGTHKAYDKLDIVNDF